MQESTLPRSLRANSLGRSGGGAGKWRRACKYVSGIEYLHRKSRCEILIGGDGISNDVIALSTVSFNVCLPSRSLALRADWRKCDSSVDGEPLGNWRWNSNFREPVASSTSLCCPAATARAPWRACSQLASCPGVFISTWKEMTNNY